MLPTIFYSGHCQQDFKLQDENTWHPGLTHVLQSQETMQTHPGGCCAPSGSASHLRKPRLRDPPPSTGWEHTCTSSALEGLISFIILDSKYYSMPKQKTLAPSCRSLHHPEVLKKIFQNKIIRLAAKKMYRHVRDRSIAFFIRR